MITTAQRTPTRQTTTAGRRVEQARYRIPAGTRALYAQRIDGRVALVDAPIDHDDRVLLIERHVESLAELDGIVAAYVEHSTQAGHARPAGQPAPARRAHRPARARGRLRRPRAVRHYPE